MPASRLPGTLRVLLAASFVSAIGGGLTLPFLVIYLHQVRHIPLGISGLLIGGVAVLALPVSPLAGALVDRVGAREVVLVAMIVEGLGIAALATVHGVLTALPAMFVFGLGQAAAWPTWNALLGVMVDDDKISRLAFARNFQLLNLGLGIGAIVGGLVVHVRQPGTFVRSTSPTELPISSSSRRSRCCRGALFARRATPLRRHWRKRVRPGPAHATRHAGVDTGLCWATACSVDTSWQQPSS
jgi:MFS family permease